MPDRSDMPRGREAASELVRLETPVARLEIGLLDRSEKDFVCLIPYL
jgi:hypothetical protein